MNIFIDADVFIGYHNPSDALNPKVEKISKWIADQKNIQLFTSWDVIDEVSTKLSYYFGKEDSLAFLSYVKENVKILFPIKKHSQQALDIFSSIKSKKISMTDCMNIILFREYEFDYMFSFDKIYAKQGISNISEAMKK